MSDVYLRYEEEPENKFIDFLSKFFELLKNKVFLIILGIIIAILILIFILFPLLTTPGSNFVDVINDNNKSTQLKSDKGSFYAKADGKATMFAKKIGNSYIVDLGRIDKAIKVQTGPFQDFRIFQRTLASTKDFLIAPKFLYNTSFALKVNDTFDKKDFTYEIEALKNDSEFTIYENNVVVFEEGLPEPKCKKKEGSFNIYICNSSFGDKNERLLSIDIKNKQNKIFVVEEGKKIAFLDTTKIPEGPKVAKVDCKFKVDPNIGPNTATCISDGTLEAKVGENSYKFEPNKEVSVSVIGKKGENNFTLSGTDSNNLKVEQNFPFKVPTDFYLSFNPKFEKYDLTNPTEIEFKIQTNENLVFNIYTNASGNTKGYSALNAEPIDTDFSYLNTVDKGINSEYTKSGLLLKLNSASTENNTKTQVYPEFINVDIEIFNESGQKILAPCKIYLKVNDKAENKSVCL
jgi:hypothetical protein